MNPNEKLLTAEYAREVIEYLPLSGLLLWNVRPRSHFKTLHAAAVWNARFSGKIAGGIMCNGYITISINYKPYLAHRLAWLIQTGNWPVDEIDHLNHVRNDNRFENLREASNEKNTRNQKLRKNNNTGFIGVHRKRNKYEARVQVDGIGYHLGVFSTVEEAALVAKKFRDEHGFHENHGLKVVA